MNFSNNVPATPPKKQGNFRIFASYSTQDIDNVKLVLDNLLQIKGVQVFFADQDLMPGDTISERIKQNIVACDIFLVFHSESAHHSSYVHHEVGIALGKNKIIIPVLLDKSKPAGMLSNVHYLDFSDEKKRLAEFTRLYNFIVNNKQTRIAILLSDFLHWQVLGCLCWQQARTTKKMTMTIENQTIIIDYTPFSELLSEIVDNRGRTCPTSNTGVPLIATNCIRNDLLYPAFENIRYVSPETIKTWFRGHPKPGDIIFVNKGTPGRVCLVPDPVNFCIAQDMVAVRADQKKIYPKYLFAVLRSSEIQTQIENMHVGTLIPHFKKGDFDKLLIPISDRKIQELIGDFYFTLSKKIELNRQMNETLEAMARAIFQSWFVDFDPVRAKVEGRDTGLPREVAALFPCEFDEVDGREVPKGWGVGTLSDVVGINTKSITQNYPYSQIDYIEISSVSKGKLESSSSINIKEAPSRAQRLVCHGDTIWSGVRPNRESYFFIQNPKENLVVSTGFIVLSPKKIPPSYLYSWVTSETFVDYLTANADGSAYPAVRVDHFGDAEILLPSQEILAEFEKIVASMRAQIHFNEQQSRTLAQIRDALLPKLMSGEIQLSS